MKPIKLIIITLIFSAVLAWLYRILFCPARIEFRPGDALEHGFLPPISSRTVYARVRKIQYPGLSTFVLGGELDDRDLLGRKVDD